MTVLTLSGENVESVFDLLGQSENAMTYSLGWTLSQCPQFLSSLSSVLALEHSFSPQVQICLQRHAGSGGFTDLEIRDPGNHHIIIEAKKGFTVPCKEQLEKYADRLIDEALSSSPLLVVLAESDRQNHWLKLNVPLSVKEVPVKSVSWSTFQDLAQQHSSEGTHAERRLLRQLIIYLKKVTTVQNQFSNEVYVVSLGGESAVSGVTHIELVEKHRRYYHPVGGGTGGWPANPPNYIAFRYGGVLQSIHHIEAYSVINDFKDAVDGCSESMKTDPHYLYTLANAIVPASRIPTNDPMNRFPNIMYSARKWCFIDLLLTCGSIAEAAFKSRERRSGGDKAELAD